jgi:hypothetical protein
VSDANETNVGATAALLNNDLIIPLARQINQARIISSYAIFIGRNLHCNCSGVCNARFSTVGVGNSPTAIFEKVMRIIFYDEDYDL